MPHQLELRPAVRTDSEDLSTRAVSFHKELSFFDFILQKSVEMTKCHFLKSLPLSWLNRAFCPPTLHTIMILCLSQTQLYISESLSTTRQTLLESFRWKLKFNLSTATLKSQLSRIKHYSTLAAHPNLKVSIYKNHKIMCA